MSNGLDSLVGVLPVILVGGVAMKMTESMFGQTQQVQPRKKRKSTRRSPLLNGHPGNFSNVWM